MSTKGGINPVWRNDGRELYYWSADGKLTAVPVRTTTSFELGVPTPLFEVRAVAWPSGGVGWPYDVARDGRFLVNTVIDQSSPPLNVVLNWLTDVGKD